jgi:hypothetical protein
MKKTAIFLTFSTKSFEVNLIYFLVLILLKIIIHFLNEKKKIFSLKKGHNSKINCNYFDLQYFEKWVCLKVENRKKSI